MSIWMIRDIVHCRGFLEQIHDWNMFAFPFPLDSNSFNIFPDILYKYVLFYFEV